MPAKRKKEEINLLPEKGFQATTTGRVLAWILSTFRVIVIVTEMIVMVAFLSRFWLDAQNSDLNEKIEQRQAVLNASQDFEKQFKDTQKRLEIFSSLVANQVNSPQILQRITESLPSDVILTQVAITKESVEIAGFTPNEKSIQQLSVNLNSKEDFMNFFPSRIVSSTNNSSVFDFTLKGVLEKEKT